MSFNYIENDSEFQSLCHEASAHEAIAFDTEFVRDTTYFPRFCLLQIGLIDGIYCIDPTRLTSLEPLRQLLDAPKPTFVAHAARQDIELLSLEAKQPPLRLLDTQIGAALTGLSDQVGYATLVSHLLDIHLSKEQTRTDWRQRPLSKAQLDYAADDVRYLLSAAERLRASLDSLARSDWWEEDSQSLLEKARHPPDRAKAWLRLPALHLLDQASGARAVAIATWREEVAMALDLPRNWVLHDETLLNWARNGAIPEGAAPMRIKNPQTQKHHIDRLRELLSSNPLEAEHQAFANYHPSIPDQRRKRLLKALTERVRTSADALGLPPPMLASRRDLETLIDSPDRSRLLTGWRQDAIGSDLTQWITQDSMTLVNP